MVEEEEEEEEDHNTGSRIDTWANEADAAAATSVAQESFYFFIDTKNHVSYAHVLCIYVYTHMRTYVDAYMAYKVDLSDVHVIGAEVGANRSTVNCVGGVNKYGTRTICTSITSLLSTQLSARLFPSINATVFMLVWYGMFV